MSVFDDISAEYSSYAYSSYAAATRTAGSSILVTQTVLIYATSSGGPASSATAVVPVPAPAVTTTSSVPKPNGLPSSARTGLIAGLTIGVFLLLLGIGASVLHRRRKRHTQRNHDDQLTSALEKTTNAEHDEDRYASDRLIPEADAVDTSRPGELDSQQRYELSGRGKEQEEQIVDLNDGNVRYEMSADR